MRKAELVANIVEKTGISKVDVMLTLENLFDEVKDSLAQGENVYLRGFGSFVVKERSAKKARNIRENKEILVPAHHVPVFKPAKAFVELVKNGKHELEDKSGDTHES